MFHIILSFHCFLSDIPGRSTQPTQQKTTICAIIGIGFLAIVIGIVFANSEGKGGELVTVYNSF